MTGCPPTLATVVKAFLGSIKTLKDEKYDGKAGRWVKNHVLLTNVEFA